MPRTKRKATEAAILAAAREHFSAQSFEQVGVRDIADAAGINVALVIRYFGSKEGLFERAVTQEVALDALFQTPREQLGETLVRYILEKRDFDPLLALLRSAANAQASELLRENIRAQFTAPLADIISGEDRDLRASLVAAQLLGVALMREVVQSEPLTTSDRARVTAYVAPLVQALLGD